MTALRWRCFTKPIDWLHLLLINSFIALQLSLMSDGGFIVNLVYSQCIGISIASALVLVTRVFKQVEPKWWTYLISVPLGVLAGLAVAIGITGDAAKFAETQNSGVGLRGVLFSVLTGAAVSWYFFVREHRLRGRIELAEQQASLAEQQARLAEQQRQLSETHLLLLQAQIEPHFLFNTLSNICALIEPRAADARRMLVSLTTYLRVSLLRARSKTSVVNDEVELLEAYLLIQKIRMGDRLQYDLKVDEQTRSLPLPPLLLQPLVENAITHGLEPELEGGTLTIDIARNNEWLNCSVVDTGPGVAASQASAGTGLGLSNIRQRLASLYGEKAKLEVIDREDQVGVCAVLTIPLALSGKPTHD